MTLIVKRYRPNLAGDYDRLLSESAVAMFNHSLRFRDFLLRIIPNSEDHYLLAYDDGELVAALPTFMTNGPYGAVVNSLPFYGSHGGFVYKENTDSMAFDALLEELSQLCAKNDAFSCTLIESPWESDKKRYGKFKANLFDKRIGQITALPEKITDDLVEKCLMDLYHQKTRNMVRKGAKSDFIVSHDHSLSTLMALHALHDENIRGIGGQSKPFGVFEAIADVFRYDQDYRIYTARKDGKITSALLVFYFKDTVEYFTPATLEEYRSEQPLSLLIFRAMRDAIVERDARQWNWGGTWLNQHGVYQFKAKWGTKDFPYNYYTKVKSMDKLSPINKNSILEDYPYFYCLPFSALDE